MAAKSTAGAMEADWITYDEAYVVRRCRRGRRRGSDALLGKTRHAPLWRWAIPESRSALDRLAAVGVPMGVVSNASGQIEGVLAHEICQVGDGSHVAMRCVVDSDVVGVAKPDPAIFDHALPHFAEFDGRGSPTSVTPSRWTSHHRAPPGCIPSSSIPTTTTPAPRSSASAPHRTRRRTRRPALTISVEIGPTSISVGLGPHTGADPTQIGVDVLGGIRVRRGGDELAGDDLEAERLVGALEDRQHAGVDEERLTGNSSA